MCIYIYMCLYVLFGLLVKPDTEWIDIHESLTGL